MDSVDLAWTFLIDVASTGLPQNWRPEVWMSERSSLCGVGDFVMAGLLLGWEPLEGL